MSKNDGGPAFPIESTVGDTAQKGMSLRDYFAAHALTGLLADPHNMNPTEVNVAFAWGYADAMLRTRWEQC